VEITNGVLNTHCYDEAVLGKVGATASEILGNSGHASRNDNQLVFLNLRQTFSLPLC